MQSTDYQTNTPPRDPDWRKKPKVDLVGRRFGKLTVLEYIPGSRKKMSRWRCKCDCGTEILVFTANLTLGHTKSCRCSYIRKSPGIIGTRFGKLTVIARDAKTGPQGAAYWVVRCDCGEERVYSGRDLPKRQSCGCAHKEAVARYGVRHGNPETACINQILRGYRSKHRFGIRFDLSTEDCRTLFASPCFYCGAEHSNAHKYYTGYEFLYNGLDRVKPDGHYTSDNVVPCCRTCNMNRRNASQSAFLSWIQQAYEHLMATGKITPSKSGNRRSQSASAKTNSQGALNLPF